MVINDLKQLGAGISNTETMFMQDKREEWTKNLSSIIPSNIKKGSSLPIFVMILIGRIKM